jgi:RNA recognition motif-containing protein
MNIYVGNLPYSVRDPELRAAFEPFGRVLSAEVIFDKRTRRSRGYGFVEMENDEEAQKAIASLNGSDFQGRELRVDASQPKSEKEKAPRAPSEPRGEPRAPRREPQPVAAATTSSAVPPPAQGSGFKGFIKRLFG